ncbi:Tripartite tricarboxylate transporter TctB family protein [Franzmannia pantelleriensis]|uniref:Tripartite tricarboxylate transporter TctB family protein n=1 Tax=Franzmannia pantelleriensis TaxID=48727 RepID=A0A1G9TZ57_9GAMM|nr:tripartite tricarboxylate transporter TctB family protein [Halomonas pantelleriensis]SDM52694.1 Tripartite tricarboxylate transporter TctB family protein [Halomonas pantelleriensis]
MQRKPSRRAPAGWWRTNQALGLGIAIAVAVLFAYLWQQDWYHREQRDGFILGFFPGLGLAAMLVTALALTLDRWRHTVVEEIATLDWRDLLWAVVLSAAALSLYALMEPLGMLLPIALFLALMMLLLGLRPWYLAAGLAAAIALIILAVFTLLGIRLPGAFLPLLI